MYWKGTPMELMIGSRNTELCHRVLGRQGD
jgi:hypothetical protein